MSWFDESEGVCWAGKFTNNFFMTLGWIFLIGLIVIFGIYFFDRYVLPSCSLKDLDD